MTIRLLGLTLVLAVMAGAQEKKPTSQKKKQAEAEIIWTGNSIYDLCQGYKKDKLSGKLGPGCFFISTE